MDEAFFLEIQSAMEKAGVIDPMMSDEALLRLMR
jgi:hypothetical protein